MPPTYKLVAKIEINTYLIEAFLITTGRRVGYFYLEIVHVEARIKSVIGTK